LRAMLYPHLIMDTNIEALLFALGRPIARTELAALLDASQEQIEKAIMTLREKPRSGIVLVDDGKEVELRVSGESAQTVDKILKEEYDRDIGKAGMEALSAVLYRGPLSRSEIDFIRGVNSSQTLRTLTVRGLVRRVPNPKDERVFLYEPTTELLSELGVERVQDLPDYAHVKEKLRTLEETYRQKQADTV